jgi:hypothetical protein
VGYSLVLFSVFRFFLVFLGALLGFFCGLSFGCYFGF